MLVSYVDCELTLNENRKFGPHGCVLSMDGEMFFFFRFKEPKLLSDRSSELLTNGGEVSFFFVFFLHKTFPLHFFFEIFPGLFFKTKRSL